MFHNNNNKKNFKQALSSCITSEKLKHKDKMECAFNKWEKKGVGSRLKGRGNLKTCLFCFQQIN